MFSTVKIKNKHTTYFNLLGKLFHVRITHHLNQPHTITGKLLHLHGYMINFDEI